MAKLTFEEKVLEELGKITATLADFERKEAMVQVDVKDVKSKLTFQGFAIDAIKSDEREALGRLHTLEEQHAQVHGEIRKLGILQENTEDKIDQLIEAVSPEMEKVVSQHLQLTEHETTLKNHTLRLKALEKTP